MDAESESDEPNVNLDPAVGSILSAQCHNCSNDNIVGENDQKRLVYASIVCFLFMIAEIVGGVLSNSLAIATDAAHLLTDFGAFMVNLFAIYLAGRKRTRKMNYGFYRAEVIGALISVLSIWLITGILFYMAIQRIVHSDYEIDATVMVITASFSIFANIVLGTVLLFRDIFHRAPSESLIPRKRISLKSAIIHVVGDFVHSLGVLVASLIIFLEPTYKIADPICTFIFSFIVLCSTYHIMKDILQVLMEGFPRHIAFNEIQNILFSIPQIVKVHNLRMWSLSLDKVALSAHVAIKKGENPIEVLKEATAKLSNNVDIFEITLQIEEVGEPVNTCSTCN